MTSVPRTPIETLELACEAGKAAGLKYVYCGNAPGQADESTHCPACHAVVIDRLGYSIRGMTLDNGRCPSCHEPVEGIWAR